MCITQIIKWNSQRASPTFFRLDSRKWFIFADNGDVAQLARALDWQSRGRGFESLLLHQTGQTHVF